VEAIREWLTALGGVLGDLFVEVRGLLETLFGRLEHPLALWLLAVQPVLWVFAIRAWFRRRRALRQLGTGLALRALTTPGGGWRTLRSLCWSTATLALVLAVAGPRWGTDPSQQATSGRDLVVVLDLSRSMLAEQPPRVERGRRALLDLADSLQRRGGHRVALVVFAARAKLVCPLTHDYDHFREVVLQQDARDLPAELRPASNDDPSGTRIGKGLLTALEEASRARDPQAGGFQDILLVSDGDDPAGLGPKGDREWGKGVQQAKKDGVAVYCVGVGDPQTAWPVPGPLGGTLEYKGKAIRSRLEDAPLKEIAHRTGGRYFEAGTRDLPQGTLYRGILQGQARLPNRDIPLATARPRYFWFFGAALALFAASLLLAGGPRRRPRPEPELAGTSKRAEEKRP
jgi:Ca-activated chloride channel family protein